MANGYSLTGYGPRQDVPGRLTRLIFDGNERYNEQWEIRFLGHMKLRDLKTTILSNKDVNQSKNEKRLQN